MKTLLVAFTATTLVTVAGVGVVEACGAKFLVATRNAKNIKVQRAAQPGRVLVYTHSDDPADTPETVAEATAVIREWLEGVGHTVLVAPDENALRDRVRGDDVDVVIMGVNSARRLKNDIASWAPGTAILPATATPTGAERARIKGEFGEMFVVGDGKRVALASVERSYQRN